jgi:hypothetical protein
MRSPRTWLPKGLILLLSSLCWPGGIAAQQPACTLKLEHLPSPSQFKGFRLGMNLEQVKALVPPVRFGPPDEFGVVKTTINPHFDPAFDQKAFGDIRTISFDFLDGKLVMLWIGYEETLKWPPLNEFVAGLSKSLGVPGVWQPKQSGRELMCDGFSLFAATIAGAPSVRITDEAAQDVIGTRREEAATREEAQVIGDSSNKSYYPSDCPARANIPAVTRIVFKDKSEAEKAGYKLSPDCQ